MPHQSQLLLLNFNISLIKIRWKKPFILHNFCHPTISSLYSTKKWLSRSNRKDFGKRFSQLISISIPPENVRKPGFLTFFRGYRIEILAWNGLTLLDRGKSEKINVNFYFHISWWCFKRFYEGLKCLHKTFWGTTKNCDNKNLC